MRSRVSIALAAGVLLHASLLGAQRDSAQGIFQVDVAVPESPAFVLIGGTPGNLLRPTLMRDFAAGLSNFTGEDGGLTTPQNLGVELAPALLLSPRLSLKTYRRAPALYRLQASAAVNTASHDDAPNQLAFGVRTSLLDDPDPRMDTVYEHDIDSLTLQLHAVSIRRLDLRERARQTDDPDVDDDASSGSASTTDTVNVVTCRQGESSRDPVTTCVVTVAIPRDPVSVLVPLERQGERIREAMRERRREWEDEHWNARSLDVAAGTRFANRDSLGNDPDLMGLALWATSGHPLGGWGQVLLGGSTGWERNPETDNLRPRSSLSSRVYVGENAYRGFVEAERRFNHPGIRGLLNAGGELRLRSSVWATFSAGVMFRPDGEKNRLVTGFTVRAAGP